jgi:hypothetical protein
MIVYGINRWKSAQASATTGSCGEVRTRDGGSDDPPVVKEEPAPPKGDATTAAMALSWTIECADEPPIRQSLRGDPSPTDKATAAMTMSPLLRPKGEGDDKPVVKGQRARGSQKMQAVRSDEDPGDNASKESLGSRPRRRRKRRTTRTLRRPSLTT